MKKGEKNLQLIDATINILLALVLLGLLICMAIASGVDLIPKAYE